MQNLIKEAVKNYLNSLNLEIKECDKELESGYVAKIETSGGLNYDIYLVVPKSKLEYISEFWFGDKNDYETEDLTREITNIIVGNAKILGEKIDKNFTISTPRFIGEYKENLIDYDDILKFEFGDECFYILFKGR